MKLYLSIWPQKDQVKALKNVGYKSILTSYYNIGTMEKDMRRFMKSRQKEDQKKKKDK